MENTVQDLVNEYHDRHKSPIYDLSIVNLYYYKNFIEPLEKKDNLYVAGADPYKLDNTPSISFVYIYKESV